VAITMLSKTTTTTTTTTKGVLDEKVKSDRVS
jgi:hypothetical protein